VRDFDAGSTKDPRFHPASHFPLFSFFEGKGVPLLLILYPAFQKIPFLQTTSPKFSRAIESILAASNGVISFSSGPFCALGSISLASIRDSCGSSL